MQAKMTTKGLNLRRSLPLCLATAGVAALVLVPLFLPGVAGAQEGQPPSKPILAGEPAALQGVKGVGVLVEGLSKDAETLGLTVPDLQTRVELKLRQSGLKVLTREEIRNEAGMPYLYLNIHVLGSAFAIQLDQRETMRSERVNQRVIGVTTWDKSLLGTGGKDYILKSVDTVLDEYCKDSLKANPNP